jgi:hypothetical protein
MYGKSLVWVAKPERLRIESNNISFGLLVIYRKHKINLT